MKVLCGMCLGMKSKDISSEGNTQIGDYIADFVCMSEKMVIEVDGGYHEQPLQQKNDQARTEFLESKGYKVIRFRNEEVDFNVKEVIVKIKEALTK